MPSARWKVHLVQASGTDLPAIGRGQADQRTDESKGFRSAPGGMRHEQV